MNVLLLQTCPRTLGSRGCSWVVTKPQPAAVGEPESKPEAGQTEGFPHELLCLAAVSSKLSTTTATGKRPAEGAGHQTQRTFVNQSWLTDLCCRQTRCKAAHEVCYMATRNGEWAAALAQVCAAGAKAPEGIPRGGEGTDASYGWRYSQQHWRFQKLLGICSIPRITILWKDLSMRGHKSLPLGPQDIPP